MATAIITELDSLFDQLEAIKGMLENIRTQSNVDATLEKRLADVCSYLDNATGELEDAMMYEHYKGYNE